MTDIFSKSPDPRRHRWWRKPSPSPEYTKGWNRIFKKKPKKEAPPKKEKQK